MVKIQLELTEKANRIAAIYKASYNLKTKEEAINSIIEMAGVVQ